MTNHIVNADQVDLNGYGLLVTATGDTVSVDKLVTLGSETTSALLATGSSHVIQVLGSVIGSSAGIQFFDPQNPMTYAGSGQHVQVFAGGYVGGNVGISSSSSGDTIVNAGTIFGVTYGMAMTADTGAATIVNEAGGLMEGLDAAIVIFGDQATSLTNHAKIKGGLGIPGSSPQYSYVSSGSGADNIKNNAWMIGEISLGSGYDKYDGSGGGRVSYSDGVNAMKVDGGGGNDQLRGGVFVDMFYGGDGEDGLFGGGGNDLLFGGADADVLVGDAGIDTLTGDDGVDSLDGGLGNDKLTGGTSADKFIFKFKPGTTNRDTITDFKHLQDDMVLENAFFKVGNPGALKAAAFYAGTKAHDADDRIIYNKATGALFYDADGAGKIAQVQFASVTKNLALSAADFLVI